MIEIDAISEPVSTVTFLMENETHLRQVTIRTANGVPVDDVWSDPSSYEAFYGNPIPKVKVVNIQIVPLPNKWGSSRREVTLEKALINPEDPFVRSVFLDGVEPGTAIHAALTAALDSLKKESS